MLKTRDDYLKSKYPGADRAQIEMAELSENYWRRRIADELLTYMKCTCETYDDWCKAMSEGTAKTERFNWCEHRRIAMVAEFGMDY